MEEPRANLKFHPSLDTDSDDAILFSQSNFDAEVKNSGKNAFVKFLAPW